jgi:predicted nucleic-acid-binding Zn-ribbon protein
MPEITPRCPKCQKTMERGHVPDVGHGQVVVPGWTQGAPERQRFFGGIKYRPKEQLPLSAFRCPGCGYVEFYALAGDSGD